VSHTLYETDGIYACLYPIMWVLAGWAWFKKACARLLRLPKPAVGSHWFDGKSKVCREIRAGKASWKALDTIYNYPFHKATSFTERLSNIWLKSPNAQGVRNRHKHGMIEVFYAFRQIAKSGHEVRLLSLAAGSAESIIRAAWMARKEGSFVKCFLADKDQSALDYALTLAKQFGISDCLEVRNVDVANPKNVRNLLREFKPSIVEMMGFLDYLDRAHAVAILKTIRSGLPKGGKFFTCNIMPNPERWFLEHVLDWQMIYRSSEELQKLVSDSGFDQVQIIVEAWMIHAIAIGTAKTNGRLLDTENRRAAATVSEVVLPTERERATVH
jgi:anti-anti-sigma regulatory factor